MSSIRTTVFAILTASLSASVGVAQQICLQASPGFHVDGVTCADDGEITGITGFDDGSGPALFVSGFRLISAGAELAAGLARWDGAQWSDTGVPARVDDIAVYDDGGGAQLYVLVNGTTISIWNGVAASASGTFWRTWLTSSGIESVPSMLCIWIDSRILSR